MCGAVSGSEGVVVHGSVRDVDDPFGQCSCYHSYVDGALEREPFSDLSARFSSAATMPAANCMLTIGDVITRHAYESSRQETGVVPRELVPVASFDFRVGVWLRRHVRPGARIVDHECSLDQFLGVRAPQW